MPTLNYLNSKQASEYTGYAVSTLKTWRCRGIGPPCFKVNNHKIVYLQSELDEFMKAKATIVGMPVRFIRKVEE